MTYYLKQLTPQGLSLSDQFIRSKKETASNHRKLTIKCAFCKEDNMEPTFPLSEARKLFWHTCKELAAKKLILKDVLPGKDMPNAEAVSVYVPCNLYPKNQCIASVQFYGGPRYYKDEEVRVVEFRFYLRFFEDHKSIFPAINAFQEYRMKDRKKYIAFQFSYHNEETSQFISKIINSLGAELSKFYGEKYINSDEIDVPNSIKLLPCYNGVSF